jgi:predicted TPR repeat methyltransferase
VLFEELQGVDHAQHFVDVAAERQHVDHLMHDHAGFVDQEGTAQATPAASSSTS